VSTINLRIEHLVLDGLELETRDGPQLRAAIETELARLLGEGALAAGGHQLVPVLRGALPTAPGRGPEGLGSAIGAAIHGSLPQ
jgi:hypothetical protein